ncbi:MAG: 50S ribosomal protein L1 [Patescibacteria group bacterium]
MTSKNTQKQNEQKETAQQQEELAYEKNKTYPIGQALELAKKMSKAKFDASIEVHFNLGIDPKKGDQQIRTAVTLPHGTGKDIKVAAFVESDKKKEVEAAGADIAGGEELIEEIKKSEVTDFDVAVAQTSMMKKLTEIAKTLGTRGLMPSPKNDTVTDDPARAVQELKKGKISFKNDNTGNIHAIIGKRSFETEKLEENFNTLLETVRKAKPAGAKGTYIKNITISSTMGPGIKVALK